MSVSLALGSTLREKDMPPHYPSFDEHDRGELPVTGRAVNYPSDYVGPGHAHPTAQLIHAVQGVMVVATEAGRWIVPPSRGLWMPAGMVHQVRMVGEVHVRTVYIRADAAPNLPTECEVVGISPLLRQLILAAIEMREPYERDSRNGRLAALLLDEVAVLPTLPLRLPQPGDRALRTICQAIATSPDEPLTLAEWAKRLGLDPKTVQRRFARDTGMTFGQWRQQARLIAALEQLAAGTKIVDVALNLGYSSPSAFATMFKRQFGETPSAYFR